MTQISCPVNMTPGLEAGLETVLLRTVPSSNHMIGSFQDFNRQNQDHFKYLQVRDFQKGARQLRKKSWIFSYKPKNDI